MRDLPRVVADVAADIRLVELTDFGDSGLTARTQEKRVMDELNERLQAQGKRPVQYRADAGSLAALRGKDQAPEKEAHDIGHYTSEWVMVARDRNLLTKLEEPVDYRLKAKGARYWDTPPIEGRHIWTDDYQSVLRVLRFLQADD